MPDKPSIHAVQAVSVCSLLLVLTVAALSTSMPLNGMNASQIAHRYDNLFLPESMISVFWIIIFALLILYTVRIQMKLHLFPAGSQPGFSRQGWLFSLANLLNGAWIVTWHLNQVRLSLGIVLMLLVILLMIYRDLPWGQPYRKTWIYRLPFTFYTGWISMFVIISAAVLLSGAGWNGGRTGPVFWALLMLAFSVALGGAILLRFRDAGFVFAQIWAIISILLHHLIRLKMAYPPIIIGAAASLAALAAGSAFVMLRRPKPVVRKIKP